MATKFQFSEIRLYRSSFTVSPVIGLAPSAAIRLQSHLVDGARGYVAVLNAFLSGMVAAGYAFDQIMDVFNDAQSAADQDIKQCAIPSNEILVALIGKHLRRHASWQHGSLNLLTE